MDSATRDEEILPSQQRILQGANASPARLGNSLDRKETPMARPKGNNYYLARSAILNALGGVPQVLKCPNSRAASSMQCMVLHISRRMPNGEEIATCKQGAEVEIRRVSQPDIKMEDL